MKSSKRHNATNSIDEVLKQFINENKLAQGLDKIKIQETWEEMMGSNIARYTEKVSLKGDTLTVYLTSSVLREELGYGKDKIIKMLNEMLGEEQIKKIRLL